MERIPQDAWRHSRGINRAGKLFVACFREVTHGLTIDIYRARYLNVRLVFAELAETIQAVQARRIDSINVADIATEAKRLLEEDILVPTLIPSRQFLYSALLAPFSDPKGTQIHPGLEIIARSVSQALEPGYAQALAQELQLRIGRDDAAALRQLTGAFATELLGLGYDIRHLYYMAGSFLQAPVLPFEEKLERFLNEVHPPRVRPFRVIFRLVFRRPMDPFPRSVAGITLHPRVLEPQLYPAVAGFLREGPNWRYAIMERVEALDRFAALKQALSLTSRSLDLLQLAEPAAQVSVYGTAAVLDHGQSHLIPIDSRVLGPPRLARNWLVDLEARFGAIQTAGHVTEQARARISSGLRYLRMGLTDDTSEGQFLNLWIGLESLFARAGRSPVEIIRHCVPRILTYRHPARLLLDLRENLMRCEALPGEPLRTNITQLPDKKAQLACLWQALRGGGLKEQLLAAAGENPLLQSRINETSGHLQSSEGVSHVMARHQTDVSWHLQRMYRARNRIVHEGATVLDLTLLSANLAAYLWTSLDELLTQLSRHRALQSIEDVVTKIDTTLASLEVRLRGEGLDQIALAHLVDPDRLWPQG